MKYTTGADPELFIFDNDALCIVPAIGLIGGTKKRPRPMPDCPSGFGVQEDNVMLEFNVPSSKTPRNFFNNIIVAMQQIQRIVSEIPNRSLSISKQTCEVLFPSEYLQSAKAQEFGCSTEYDAYEQGRAVESLDPDVLAEDDGAGWRFGGGHLHLGYTSAAPPFVAASFCDIYLGLPSLSKDKQERRRQYYGRAGRYRPTSYGIEYRTLSNYWIWKEREIEQVANRLDKVMQLLHSPHEEIQRLYAEVPWLDVRHAIDNVDHGLARDLMTYCRNDLDMVGL